MRGINLRYIKYVIITFVVIIILLLGEDAAFSRNILYIALGIISMAKTRKESVKIIDYAFLILLLYVMVSIFFLDVMLPREIVYAILKRGELYSIFYLLLGEQIGYIFLPAKESDKI